MGGRCTIKWKEVNIMFEIVDFTLAVKVMTLVLPFIILSLSKAIVGLCVLLLRADQCYYFKHLQ